MEKFYNYLFGIKVEIFTDHKLMLGILMSKKGEPLIVASRLQRYVIRMSISEYQIIYRRGKENGNADGLSCLPIKEALSEEDKEEEMCWAQC